MDRSGIARRLRGLLGGQDGGDFAAIARRLGVEEVSLRMSVDELSPFPTIDVLSAVVITYGIDPTWLITGDYNPVTHRTVDDGYEAATEVVRVMIEQPVPVAPPPSQPHLRLVKDG